MKKEIFKKELNYIKEKRLKMGAEMLLEQLPDYFFSIPASSTGKYHPAFASGDGGLVRHTKVAMRIAYELLENPALFNQFTPIQRDLLLIALMLHDGLKEGIVKEKYTRFDHPIIMASWIKEKNNIGFQEEELLYLSHVIESHMGNWNTNSYSDIVLPLPVDGAQKFVHMCDFLASRKFLSVTFDNMELVD